MAYEPTHDVPAGGLPAWSQPDGSAPPVTTLAEGLDVQLLEMRGQWGHVVCSNGWEGWVDGGRLSARASAPEPVAQPEPAVQPEPATAVMETAPVTPATEPEPVASSPVEPTPAQTAETVEAGPAAGAADASDAGAGSSSADFDATHSVPTEGLAMWAEPDPSQPALATLAGGTGARVVEERGQWARVTLANGWEGWVDSARLVPKAAPQPEPAPQAEPAPQPPAFTVSHVAPEGGLQAWAEPDPSQPAATTLAAGTELRLTEQRGQWARVEASNGWWGWVDSARLVAR